MLFNPTEALKPVVRSIWIAWLTNIWLCGFAKVILFEVPEAQLPTAATKLQTYETTSFSLLAVAVIVPLLTPATQDPADVTPTHTVVVMMICCCVGPGLGLLV